MHARPTQHRPDAPPIALNILPAHAGALSSRPRPDAIERVSASERCEWMPGYSPSRAACWSMAPWARCHWARSRSVIRVLAPLACADFTRKSESIINRQTSSPPTSRICQRPGSPSVNKAGSPPVNKHTRPRRRPCRLDTKKHFCINISCLGRGYGRAVPRARARSWDASFLAISVELRRGRRMRLPI